MTFILVVSLESLDCFDVLIWLRSGAAAAQRLGLTQSTVSRNVRSVSRLFNITAQKANGEWQTSGDTTLLNLERVVHQNYRWTTGRALRIEAQYYSGPLFCNTLPQGWQVGNFDFLEVHTPLQHLRTGVIDVWIGCYPDIPDADDEDLVCFDLTRLPTRLVVSAGHPLAAMGNSVRLSDIRNYPSLALPDGAFPRVQAVLQDLGLWNLPIDVKRYDIEKWEGRIEDLIVGYATCFTIDYFQTSQVFLPIAIPLVVGDSLIVRRDFADHPRFLELLHYLKGKALQLSERFPEVRIA